MKGKKELISVFEFLDVYEEGEMELKLKSKKYFEQGVQLASENKLTEALSKFNNVLELDNHDKPAKVIRDRIESRLVTK